MCLSRNAATHMAKLTNVGFRSPWEAAQSKSRHDAIWLAGELAVTALLLAIIVVAVATH